MGLTATKFGTRSVAILVMSAGWLVAKQNAVAHGDGVLAFLRNVNQISVGRDSQVAAKAQHPGITFAPRNPTLLRAMYPKLPSGRLFYHDVGCRIG
jgi:hypothetical protein